MIIEALKIIQEDLESHKRNLTCLIKGKIETEQLIREATEQVQRLESEIKSLSEFIKLEGVKSCPDANKLRGKTRDSIKHEGLVKDS